MHIPSCETSEIEVLRFDEALKSANEPSDEYDVDRWLYVPNFYSEYRFLLGTRNRGRSLLPADPENPEKTLICVGINPSTARPDDLDNTLKSVQRVARFNGYEHFLMYNVYAQRATDPDDMEEHYNMDLHGENLKAFRYALSLTTENSHEKPAVWAAWGTIIEKRPYLPQCVRDLIAVGQEYGAVWYSAGKRSKKGHPHHPLYLRKDSPLEPFDVTAYLDQL